ncbi:hypothetical protein ACLOJK_011582 [Asimina triloba]
MEYHPRNNARVSIDSSLFVRIPCDAKTNRLFSLYYYSYEFHGPRAGLLIKKHAPDEAARAESEFGGGVGRLIREDGIRKDPARMQVLWFDDSRPVGVSCIRCLRLTKRTVRIIRRSIRAGCLGGNCLTEMGCCGCFGFLSKPRRFLRSVDGAGNQSSDELLLPDDEEDADGFLYSGEFACMVRKRDGKVPTRTKSSEELLLLRAQSGLICREVPVKETRHVIRSEWTGLVNLI